MTKVAHSPVGVNGGSKPCPSALPVIPEGIPDELKALPQWVLWGHTLVKENWQKVPYQASGSKARSNDRATWCPFEQALACHHANPGKWDGIGFVFTEECGIVGVDLDECRNPETGQISAHAQVIIQDLPSYAEVSPSGTGVKLWVRGKKPSTYCRFLVKSPELKQVEVFSTERYFTVTGHRLPGSPTEIRNAQAALDRHFAEGFRLGKGEAHDDLDRFGQAAQPRRPGVSIEERAIAYLATMDPSISGNGGHDDCYWPARVVAYGFDLGAEKAFDLLKRHFNPRCQPPWSDRELWHKCQDADRKPYGKPRGWLLREQAQVNGKAPPQATTSANVQTGAQVANGMPQSKLATTCLTDIRVEPITWLVDEQIPLGKLTLLTGEGGHGKSTVLCHLAARVTRGLPAFGLTYAVEVEPSSVLLFLGEDDLADTVKPRLLAADADLARIFAVDGVEIQPGQCRPFSLLDVDILDRELASRPDVRLAIVDPLKSYVGRCKVDDHRDAELRALLSGLTDMAARRKVAIVAIVHLNRGGHSAVSRINGSVAYSNIARQVLLLAPDPDDRDRRLLLPSKSNLSADRRGVVFHLEGLSETEAATITQPMAYLSDELKRKLARQLYRAVFTGRTSANPDEVLQALAKAARKEKDDAPNRLEQLIDALKQSLGSFAWPDEEVKDVVLQAGFSFHQFKEAKKRLKESDNLRPFPLVKGGAWWIGFGERHTWTHRPEGQPFSLAPPTPPEKDLTDLTDLADLAVSTDSEPSTTKSVKSVKSCKSVKSVKSDAQPDIDDLTPFDNTPPPPTQHTLTGQ